MCPHIACKLARGLRDIAYYPNQKAYKLLMHQHLQSVQDAGACVMSVVVTLPLALRAPEVVRMVAQHQVPLLLMWSAVQMHLKPATSLVDRQAGAWTA